MFEPDFWKFYGIVLAILCGWTIVALLFALVVGRFLGFSDLDDDDYLSAEDVEQYREELELPPIDKLTFWHKDVSRDPRG